MLERSEVERVLQVCDAGLGGWVRRTPPSGCLFRLCVAPPPHPTPKFTFPTLGLGLPNPKPACREKGAWV